LARLGEGTASSEAPDLILNDCGDFENQQFALLPESIIKRSGTIVRPRADLDNDATLPEPEDDLTPIYHV
jgi:hypothetical protein